VFALLRSRSAALPCSPSFSFIASTSLATAPTHRGGNYADSQRRFALAQLLCRTRRCASLFAAGSLATALSHRVIALLRSAQHHRVCSASLSLSCAAVHAVVQLYCCWLIGNCTDAQSHRTASLCSASLCLLASLSLGCAAGFARVQLYCCWLIGNCADAQSNCVASLCSASLLLLCFALAQLLCCIRPCAALLLLTHWQLR